MGKRASEERRFSVERTHDGVLIRIIGADEKDVIDPILLPFTEAMKLGRILIANAKSGITQTELFVRKFAEIEHEIRKFDTRLRELTKLVDELKTKVESREKGV